MANAELGADGDIASGMEDVAGNVGGIADEYVGVSADVTRLENQLTGAILTDVDGAGIKGVAENQAIGGPHIERAGAGDGVGNRDGVRTKNGEGGIVGNISRHPAARAARAELQDAGADGGGSGVRIIGQE